MVTVICVSLFGHEGQYEWSPNIPGDLEKMKEFFTKKLKAGFNAFVFTKDGKTHQIKKFDENAERIIFASTKTVVLPPLGGG